MFRRAGWAILVTAVICVAAAVPWWRDETNSAHTAEVAETARQLPSANGDAAVPVHKNASPPRSQVPQQSDRGADYAAQLRAATDYLDFVRKALPAARAGDPSAQFHIFRALDYCAVEYRVHIDRGGVRSTLDDALSRAAARWPHDSETVRLVHSRCHKLMEADEGDLGNRGEWLRRASEGGHPLAQAIASHTLIGPSPITHNDEVAASENGRSLLAMAIRSGDPAVIWEIGNFGLAPEIGDDLANPGLAWILAACHRGYDCSPRSDSVRALCAYDLNCQPYESLADVLRRGAGDEYPELEARARWINEKIEEGDWEALGF